MPSAGVGLERAVLAVQLDVGDGRGVVRVGEVDVVLAVLGGGRAGEPEVGVGRGAADAEQAARAARGRPWWSAGRSSRARGAPWRCRRARGRRRRRPRRRRACRAPSARARPCRRRLLRALRRVALLASCPSWPSVSAVGGRRRSARPRTAFSSAVPSSRRPPARRGEGGVRASARPPRCWAPGRAGWSARRAAAPAALAAVPAPSPGAVSAATPVTAASAAAARDAGRWWCGSLLTRLASRCRGRPSGRGAGLGRRRRRRGRTARRAYGRPVVRVVLVRVGWYWLRRAYGRRWYWPSAAVLLLGAVLLRLRTARCRTGTARWYCSAGYCRVPASAYGCWRPTRRTAAAAAPPRTAVCCGSAAPVVRPAAARTPAWLGARQLGVRVGGSRHRRPPAPSPPAPRSRLRPPPARRAAGAPGAPRPPTGCGRDGDLLLRQVVVDLPAAARQREHQQDQRERALGPDPGGVGDGVVVREVQPAALGGEFEALRPAVDGRPFSALAVERGLPAGVGAVGDAQHPARPRRPGSWRAPRRGRTATGQRGSPLPCRRTMVARATWRSTRHSALPSCWLSRLRPGVASRTRLIWRGAPSRTRT